ncbi:peptidoglycan D,D-transpeptidase FtsI family protein [Paradesulfitobacterium ferrireducens]|uniref:peptidoglycan D,D-transpeptidase FtsI family protein n=1 Tax=Paradesulfitobacterium ferrireducens TaxID=2816476 RepID=UPI001A8CF7D4|nr:penicillin-binding transpeptidase domain-containing protein [Paradesulfitobacterium ferrireducens]
MIRGLRQVALGIASSFILLSLGLVYWQVVKSDALLQNPANRRLVMLEGRVLRGGIFDRNGEVLAQTKKNNGKSERVYPKGEAFEPLLGYATLAHGSAGLEAGLANWLLGMKNATPAQELQRMFNLPRAGDDVVLTLDSRLQKTAYEALKGKVGAAVALDPRTGAVLALVSQPSYNPNTLEEKWDAISKGKDGPLLNHAFALFPPGSTMKVVTSAALLRSNLNVSDLYQCTGSTVINGQVIREQNDRAHGWVNYNMALAASCNTYFATHGVEAGEERFLTAAKNFGFGQKIPFELYVPPSQITNGELVPKTLDRNLLAASTFGQGEVLVSPFHMALIASGIANSGQIMTPYLVERVLDSDQNILYKNQAKPWLTALSPEEADKVKSAMISAVNDGTAAPGALPNVQVAAKTGSAEPGGNVPTHAWYIAFAPADKPTIAVAVLVEHGGTGGGAAAPIAQAMIAQALSEGR